MQKWTRFLLKIFRFILSPPLKLVPPLVAFFFNIITMITLFKTIKDTATPFPVTAEFVFNKIRSGAVRPLVEQIRLETDKDKRNTLKAQLPAICFSGEFNHRSKGGFKRHSGFICLDFDHFADVQQMNDAKEKLKLNEYTHALFVSPSGDGLKLIIKIPDSATAEEHTQYYIAVCDSLKIDTLDTKTKDVARVCYMSFDADIYINNDSKIWDIKEEYEQKVYAHDTPTLALNDSSRIIEQLRKWWDKKYGMVKGERNANLYILAGSFNDYGVPYDDAINYCMTFQEPGFSSVEITGCVRSAYSNRSSHGTKFFNDVDTLKTIKQMSASGHSKKDIHDRLQKKRIPKAELDAAIESVNKEMSTNVFWSTNDKGAVSINNNDFRLWLGQHGFFKYYHEKSTNYVYIHKENNLIDNSHEVMIKDYVLDYLIKNDHFKMFEYLAPKPLYFSDKYLNILPNLDIQFKKDTKDTCYLYFKNKAIEITKDAISEIDYIDLDGFVWKQHLINSDFKKVDFEGCDFQRFIFNVSGKDKLKEKSIRSTIGYLLHSYKDSASNFAVILNDENISENPNGGTGKGIIINAIGKLKRSSVIDGKTFSFEKSFPYQTVSIDTQLIVFDDVRKNFNFENLFSIVTEGITIEKKNKDAIKLDIDKSPKVLISTNYTVGGDSTSFARRKWDVELSQHYNLKNTPLKEFGRLLFDQWPKDEWDKFYSYMIDCIQLYLREGVIRVDFTNSKLRLFIASTCTEFAEWVSEDNIKTGERYTKSKLHEQFIREFPDRKMIQQKTFNKWVKQYAIYKDLEFSEGNTQGERWYSVGKDYSFLELPAEEAPF